MWNTLYDLPTNSKIIDETWMFIWIIFVLNMQMCKLIELILPNEF